MFRPQMVDTMYFKEEHSFHADLQLWPDYVMGKPMASWACQSRSPSMHAKYTWPSREVAELWADVKEHNHRILNSVGPSNDELLDMSSWEKTVSECCEGSLLVPFYSLSEIPTSRVRLVPWVPIWEQRGGDQGPTLRNIDDCAAGGQNDTCGLQQFHRPCNLTAWAATTRLLNERFPHNALEGYRSDFKGAYRQDTSDPDQADLFGVTTWDPIKQKVAIALALAQLFGSCNAALNFTRIPDWCCFCVAILFCIPMQNCVDDMHMLSQERSSVVSSGWLSWRAFANLCGWDIPDSKSPHPAGCFQALGGSTDLSPLPELPARLLLTEDRLQALLKELLMIKAARKLLPGLAGRINGKLQWTTSLIHGRFGVAMLGPFCRRQCEPGRAAYNKQLSYAVDWWLEVLPVAPPREIPFDIRDLPVAVSYSDRKGTAAGIGVAIWSPKLRSPEAGFMHIPECIRSLWSQRSNGSSAKYDIQDIEAVGPLVALETWPHILAGSLWMHWIDNNGALACLVNGCSSVESSDVIAGMTWSRIATLRIWPWFDQVNSASNPVDKLSRGDVSGSWQLVKLRFPTKELERRLQLLRQ
jgi:hypothetical protein